MKRIQLITTPITNSQTPKDFLLNYRLEFLRLIETVPEGLTASQMGTAIKVASKLRDCEASDHLLLEDAEWEYLKNKVTSARFNLIAPEIVAMVEAVEKAAVVGAYQSVMELPEIVAMVEAVEKAASYEETPKTAGV